MSGGVGVEVDGASLLCCSEWASGTWRFRSMCAYSEEYKEGMCELARDARLGCV